MKYVYALAVIAFGLLYSITFLLSGNIGGTWGGGFISGIGMSMWYVALVKKKEQV